MTARTRLRIVGALFLIAFPLFAGGQALLADRQAATGLALVLLNSGAVFAIGLLLRPAVTTDAPRTANIYLLARVAEGVLLAAGATALFLGHDELNDWGYRAGMAALALGSLPFCWWLWRTRRAAPWFALLGLAGYASLFAEIVSKAISATMLWLLLPVALFELGFGLWLLSGIRTANFVR